MHTVASEAAADLMKTRPSLAIQRGFAHALGVEEADRVVRARHRLLSLLVGGGAAGEDSLRERISVLNRVTVYDRPWGAVVVVAGIVRTVIGVVGPVPVVCLSTSAPLPSLSSLLPPP